MRPVTETLTVLGSETPLRTLERDEDLLLAPPHAGPMKLWTDPEPLTVVHYPQAYVAQPFAPPRGVYESDQLRIEWQIMDNRQPFYHRNCDVDEISYQIAGERTLMTELGVVEHRAGEFSRIPRGVGHDNYGRQESHLLFYSPAPVGELSEPVRRSEAVFPPFPGWQARPVNEAVTQCMGTPGHDIAVFPIDEQRLLEHVHREEARLQVLATAGTPGVRWHYGSESFRLGSVFLAPTDGREYRRDLGADEIQYQVDGRRTLVSQHGIIELAPGDFVRIPLGVVHASIAAEPNEYVTVLSDRALPQIAQTSRTAEPVTGERLAAARAEVRAVPAS